MGQHAKNFTPAFLCTAVVTFLAFYATGVIDRSSARELISERLETVCENIDEITSSAEQINSEIYDSFRSKARVVSMMLEKNPGFYSDESSLEEIRVAIGAEVIGISDENGIIKYSTDMSVGESSVYEEFLPAIENKVFSKAVMAQNDGKKIVMTGSSRLDKPGVIQITFSLETYQQQLGLTELSSAVTQMPIMKHGHLAVIDTNTNTYISHTDSFLNNSAVQFPPEEFSQDEGWFPSEYDGKRVLVKYKRHDTMITAGFLPYSEVYRRRNAVVKWVLFSMAVLTGVILLSMRNYIIRKTPMRSK